MVKLLVPISKMGLGFYPRFSNPLDETVNLMRSKDNFPGQTAYKDTGICLILG